MKAYVASDAEFLDALRAVLGLGPLNGSAVSTSYDRKPEKRRAASESAYRGGSRKRTAEVSA